MNLAEAIGAALRGCTVRRRAGNGRFWHLDGEEVPTRWVWVHDDSQWSRRSIDPEDRSAEDFYVDTGWPVAVGGNVATEGSEMDKEDDMVRVRADDLAYVLGKIRYRGDAARDIVDRLKVACGEPCQVYRVTILGQTGSVEEWWLTATYGRLVHNMAGESPVYGRRILQVASVPMHELVFKWNDQQTLLQHIACHQGVLRTPTILGSRAEAKRPYNESEWEED